jgi:hypothetical protein
MMIDEMKTDRRISCRISGYIPTNIAAFVAAIGLSACASGPVATGPEWLFMQTATSGGYQNGAITLTGVAQTIAFTERPYRRAKHISNEEFATFWSADGGTFAADPPNASMSYDINGKTAELVLELNHIRLTGDEIEYEIRILDGNQPPQRFESASLFIDCVGMIEVCDSN